MYNKKNSVEIYFLNLLFKKIIIKKILYMQSDEPHSINKLMLAEHRHSIKTNPNLTLIGHLYILINYSFYV